MSQTGCCYDNAVAESVFHSLKVEWLHGREISDRQAVRSTVFQYIEWYYNKERRHSSLGYLSPCAFESGAKAGRHHAPPQDAQREMSPG
ncbi:MAG: hypothetical protein EA402_12080 [Planctomycetota bacterium]|nr:MAG: hypothetical protein EA402_12080 [Planctomycetota bacterium]